MPSYDDPSVMVDIDEEIIFRIDADYLWLNSRFGDDEFLEYLDAEIYGLEDQLTQFLEDSAARPRPPDHRGSFSEVGP